MFRFGLGRAATELSLGDAMRQGSLVLRASPLRAGCGAGSERYYSGKKTNRVNGDSANV